MQQRSAAGAGAAGVPVRGAREHVQRRGPEAERGPRAGGRPAAGLAADRPLEGGRTSSAVAP
jgi:hypothetical protein